MIKTQEKEEEDPTSKKNPSLWSVRTQASLTIPCLIKTYNLQLKSEKTGDVKMMN